jgi:hypothetical protein
LSLWALVPVYGLWRLYVKEPRKLVQAVIASALDAQQAARANAALIKARNWGVIVFGAVLVAIGAVLDAIGGA